MYCLQAGPVIPFAWPSGSQSMSYRQPLVPIHVLSATPGIFEACVYMVVSLPSATSLEFEHKLVKQWQLISREVGKNHRLLLSMRKNLK